MSVTVREWMQLAPVPLWFWHRDAQPEPFLSIPLWDTKITFIRKSCQGAVDNQSATHAKGGKCWILQRGHYLTCSELLEAAKSPRVIIFFHQISFVTILFTPRNCVTSWYSVCMYVPENSVLSLVLIGTLPPVHGGWTEGEQGWTWVSPVARAGAIKALKQVVQNTD